MDAALAVTHVKLGIRDAAACRARKLGTTLRMLHVAVVDGLIWDAKDLRNALAHETLGRVRCLQDDPGRTAEEWVAPFCARQVLATPNEDDFAHGASAVI
jgi:hypothetical protein